MPLNYGDLKDKHIRLEGTMYRPYVHIFGEIDPRPLDLCETLYKAQRELLKWPADCYEGPTYVVSSRTGKPLGLDSQIDYSFALKYKRRKAKKSKRRRSGYFGRSFGKVPKQCW